MVRGGAFGRCLNYEGKMVMNEISILQKDRLQKEVLILPPCEDKMRSLWPRRDSHLTMLAPWFWTSGYRTVRNKFIPIEGHFICLSSCLSSRIYREEPTGAGWGRGKFVPEGTVWGFLRISKPGKGRNKSLAEKAFYSFPNLMKEQSIHSGIQQLEDIKKGIFKSFLLQNSSSN